MPQCSRQRCSGTPTIPCGVWATLFAAACRPYGPILSILVSTQVVQPPITLTTFFPFYISASLLQGSCINIPLKLSQVKTQLKYVKINKKKNMVKYSQMVRYSNAKILFILGTKMKDFSLHPLPSQIAFFQLEYPLHIFYHQITGSRLHAKGFLYHFVIILIKFGSLVTEKKFLFIH